MDKNSENAPVDLMAEKYPNIAEWVFGGARIEIGNDDQTPVLARAIDEGGVAWEGAAHCRTLDEIFGALEAGIAAWNDENGG